MGCDLWNKLFILACSFVPLFYCSNCSNCLSCSIVHFNFQINSFPNFQINSLFAAVGVFTNSILHRLLTFKQYDCHCFVGESTNKGEKSG